LLVIIKMSVVTKSTVLYSERRGATYKAGDEIELYIPPSLQLLNKLVINIVMQVLTLLQEDMQTLIEMLKFAYHYGVLVAAPH
jgi:hypothetical protein